MNKFSKPPQRHLPNLATSLIAVVLLLVFGIGHRLASAHFSEAVGTVVVKRGTLNALPMNMGEWTGREVPLDERVVQATDTDDHVHRVYTDSNGQAVTLYLACGIRMRDLMPHRPEVCYPSAGWILEGKRSTEINGPAHEPHLAQVLRFRQGGLGNTRMSVLNYYLVDGRHCPDVSLLRSQAWRVGTGLTYAAQVQVAATAHPLQDRTDEAVSTFAAVAAPEIQKLLDELVKTAQTQSQGRKP